MVKLDQLDKYQNIDPSGLRQRLKDFPGLCQSAWENVNSVNLPSSWKDCEHVVICGMGGSAIVGDLASDLVTLQQTIPVTVVRGFSLPFRLTQKHLVILCSYSGDTAETLSLFRQANQFESGLLVVAGGGELSSLATENGHPFIKIDVDCEPRNALGYNLMIVLGVLSRIGCIGISEIDFQQSLSAVSNQVMALCEDTPESKNLAKQLANDLSGKAAVIYSGGLLTGMVLRWKTQIHEHAKAIAFNETIPELLHNSIESLDEIALNGNNYFVLLMRPSGLTDQLLRSYEAIEKLLIRQRVPHKVVLAPQDSHIAQILTMIVLGDYVSYYMALDREVEPSRTSLIDFGKFLTQGSKPNSV